MSRVSFKRIESATVRLPPNTVSPSIKKVWLLCVKLHDPGGPWIPATTCVSKNSFLSVNTVIPTSRAAINMIANEMMINDLHVVSTLFDFLNQLVHVFLAESSSLKDVLASPTKKVSSCESSFIFYHQLLGFLVKYPVRNFTVLDDNMWGYINSANSYTRDININAKR